MLANVQKEEKAQKRYDITGNCKNWKGKRRETAFICVGRFGIRRGWNKAQRRGRPIFGRKRYSVSYLSCKGLDARGLKRWLRLLENK